MRHETRASSIIAAGVAVLFSTQAIAAPVDSRPADRLQSCLKSVSALGAQISHSEVTTPDGRPAYQFVVRTNGLDYRVKCDAATGVVGDVTPAGIQN